MAVSKKVRSYQAALRNHALSFPEAYEDHPWGETAVKVKGKVFVFMGVDGQDLTFSVKLPQSRDLALSLPLTEPTHYGLGKHGWVTVRITGRKGVPLDIVKTWVGESYRSVAPAKLAAQVEARPTPRRRTESR